MAPVAVRHLREKSQVLPPNQRKAQSRESNSSELCGTETEKNHYGWGTNYVSRTVDTLGHKSVVWTHPNGVD